VYKQSSKLGVKINSPTSGPKNEISPTFKETRAKFKLRISGELLLDGIGRNAQASFNQAVDFLLCLNKFSFAFCFESEPGLDFV